MNVIPETLYQERYTALEDQRWSLQDALDIGRRRWRSVAVCTVVLVAAAAGYLALAQSRYTATAVLVMDTKQTPPSPSQLSQEPVIDPAVVESQLEILKSERIAQDVVDKLHLADDPRFAGGAPGLQDRLVDWVSGRTRTPPTAETLRRSATGAVMHSVKVTRTGHSYLAEIAATTLDPARSADIANGIAEAYIQDQLDSRLGSNKRTVAWMAQRVSEVKAQADAAAAAVARYRDAHTAEIARGDAAVGAALRNLSDEADAARNDFDALQNRSLRLTQFIQQQSLPMTESRLLTAAEPPLAKSAPKTAVVLLLALVGGILVGIGIAALREATDRKLRRPQQVKAALGLPVVGTVPAVGRSRAGMLAQLFDSRRPWCGATETLRAMKVLVDHTVRRDGGTVIGIVSPWPGEGKSTLALNFASMLAEIGARVLVIDADFRKPDLSAALGSMAEHGLADLVDGTAAAERCVVRTDAGFDLLGRGAGEAPLHPFDKLGSQRMQGALAGARVGYDYVLVDLPAMLISVDAQAAARFVDTFVFVAEAGRTTIEDATRALATSETLANRIVAVVLNKSRAPERALRRRARRSRRALVAA